MTIKEIAFEIENLQIEAEKVNSFQNTLFEAIYRGDNTPETYEWAFVALGDYTFSLKNRLNEVELELFRIIRTEQEAV